VIDRLMNLIGIGRLKLVNDDHEIMGFQVSQGDTGSDTGEAITDDIPAVLHFGLSSNPPLESEVVMVRRGGDRSQSVAIGTSHRPSRPKGLKPGDTILYDVRGRHILLNADEIEIDAKGGPVRVVNATTVTIVASAKVRLETPSVETTGDFIGRCDGAPVSLNALHDAYDAHKHNGVTAGAALTGPTDHNV
jgi:phage gp45-like